MPERRFPETLIPPGINDERSRALLKAFEWAASHFDFTKTLMRTANEMPDEFLSLAFFDRSLDEFVAPAGVPETVARNFIDGAWPLHEKKGTDEGVKLGQQLMGFEVDVLQWWQENPPAHHDTHVIEIDPDAMLFEQLGANEQAQIARTVNATKRWSQGSALRMKVTRETPVYVGAAGALGLEAQIVTDNTVRLEAIPSTYLGTAAVVTHTMTITTEGMHP